MYVLYVIIEYLYPLLTTCHISLTLLAVKLFIQNGCQKENDSDCWRWHLWPGHTYTHKWSHARTLARTHTHVLFKSCICRKHRYDLNCVSKVYMYIFFMYFSVLFVCILRIYYFLISVFVYTATCETFIVFLFIKCSKIIGGIKSGNL